ncbi:MAG: ADP-glyceromanno-heptose 6-epimerase [Saprospiraceae bacterium]|nr:ADP-glyceromanno-heptose 6-epimerase [Saprospiraceae bacterium]MDW8229614.1 ADP-glyceromanno-heptose 6-epimerase [Saprospiraceae bacterium]
MFVVTGAAGFIGSCMVRRLEDAGYNDVVAVDDFSRADKEPNLAGKRLRERVHRDRFLAWLDAHWRDVEAIFHLGARTDTTEKDTTVFDALNLHYSQQLWQRCAEYNIPFLYASSAATYGAGEQGYSDDHERIALLRPLNPYGQSKQDFDMWLLQQAPQAGIPWAGFKFFNVYGPNEYHKGRMASVIFHTAQQIRTTGSMRLFRSHRPDFRDGEQSRDFIYVKDVVEVLLFFLEKRPPSAIYNLGTGQARTFLDLALNTFRAMDAEPNIAFIDTPADIRDTYQYFTEADMTKLRQQAGYSAPFYSLEDGTEDYVRGYLREKRYW